MAAPSCQLCGRRSAFYVCQDCGRLVCPNCFDLLRWSCSESQRKFEARIQERYATGFPFPIAMWLFFAAFAIMFIGMLLMAVGSTSGLKNVGAGGAILIGPIPILLAGGPYSAVPVILAGLLTVVSVAVFLLIRSITVAT